MSQLLADFSRFGPHFAPIRRHDAQHLSTPKREGGHDATAYSPEIGTKIIFGHASQREEAIEMRHCTEAAGRPPIFSKVLAHTTHFSTFVEMFPIGVETMLNVVADDLHPSPKSHIRVH